MACKPENAKHEDLERKLIDLESELPIKKARVVSLNDDSNDRSEDHNNNVNNNNEVVYEGGLCVAGEDYSTYYEAEVEEDNGSMNMTPGTQEEEDVEIELNGKQYRVPYTSECHLCRDNMYLCIRKTRYRGEIKEYPAYRCIRKGCQTFRSVRKVFSNYFDDFEYSSRSTSPVCLNETKPICTSSAFIRAERVALPTRSRDINALTLTDRMKMTNQKRSRLFSEFSNKLCRDIAANRNLRPKRHDEPSGQGTLLYITKELSAHQIMDLQDAVIKVLINQKKMPIPLHAHDLPMFAPCPWSRNQLEQGLRTDEGFEAFTAALSSAPQPPLPHGFVQKEDNTLIYRDPKPYNVPNCLTANPPEKQAVNEAMYEKRKSEQEAKKFDRRYNEKRLRAWKSVKKEFDLVEDMSANFQPIVAQNVEGSEYTLQQLMERVSEKKGSIKKISRSDSNKERKMTWINSDDDEADSRNDLPTDYLQQHYSENLPASSMVIETPGDDKKSLGEVSIHGNMQQINPPALASIPVRASTPYSPYMFASFQCASPGTPAAAYFVPTRSADLMYSAFGAPSTPQFMMPPTSSSMETGAIDNTRHTPSALSSFLTSYVPSPIAKSAPVDFNDVPKQTNVPNNIDEAQLILNGNEEKIIETSLKFDPPNI